MVASAAFFTLMTLCIKLAGVFERTLVLELQETAAIGASRFAADTRVFGALEAVFVRSLPMALLCALLLMRDAREGRFSVRDLPRTTAWWLFSRGVVGASSMTCLYYATLHAPFAATSLLYNTSVFFTVALAHVFLGERVPPVRLALIAGGFACVALVLADGLFASPQAANARGLAAALVSGLLLSLTSFSIRKLHGLPSDAILLSLALAGLAIASIGFFLPAGMAWPRTQPGWALLLASSVPAIAGQKAFTAALRGGPAALVAPGQFMGPVFATLAGVFVFHEPLSVLKAMGGVGVICFGVLVYATNAAGVSAAAVADAEAEESVSTLPSEESDTP